MNKFSRINVSAYNVNRFRCFLSNNDDFQSIVDDLTTINSIGAVAYREGELVVFFMPDVGFDMAYEILKTYSNKGGINVQKR